MPTNTVSGSIAVPLGARIGFGVPDTADQEPTGPSIIATDGDPNGTVQAPKGTLALDSAGPSLWQNDAGGLVWTLVAGGGGGGGQPVLLLGLDSAVNPSPVVAPPPSAASGTATVFTAPLTLPASMDVGGVTLTGVGVPRTPGSDDFDATITPASALALEIIQAINDPINNFNDIMAFSGGGAVVVIEAERGGVEGNSVTLGATTTPPGGIVVSGPTLTGGGVRVPTTLTFETPGVDLLLKQLFFHVAADQLLDASVILLLTGISVDGGPNLLTGLASVPLVAAATPATSPELNIPLPAGSVVTVEVEDLAALPALAIAGWTAIPLPSTSPPMRMLLGCADAVIGVPGTDATTAITVTSAALVLAGDVLVFTDVGSDRPKLTGAPGARTSGSDDFDATGSISAIVASIVAAINDGNNNFDGYIAVDADPVVLITDENSGTVNNGYGMIEVYSAGMTPAVASFSGGTNSLVTLVFEAAPADAILERLYLTAVTLQGAIIVTNALILDSITIDGGPELLEGQSPAALLSASGLQASPLLDIPISAGEVVTVIVEAPLPTAVIATWTTRAP
jgi:hypothetical protein